MVIKVDYAILRNVSANIAKLKNEAFEIENCLLESVGNAADMEKQIIEQLKQICTVTFPAMLDSTCNLLNTIADDFEKTDRQFSLRPEDKIKNKVQ